MDQAAEVEDYDTAAELEAEVDELRSHLDALKEERERRKDRHEGEEMLSSSPHSSPVPLSSPTVGPSPPPPPPPHVHVLSPATYPAETLDIGGRDVEAIEKVDAKEEKGASSLFGGLSLSSSQSSLPEQPKDSGLEQREEGQGEEGTNVAEDEENVRDGGSFFGGLSLLPAKSSTHATQDGDEEKPDGEPSLSPSAGQAQETPGGIREGKEGEKSLFGGLSLAPSGSSPSQSKQDSSLFGGLSLAPSAPSPSEKQEVSLFGGLSLAPLSSSSQASVAPSLSLFSDLQLSSSAGQSSLALQERVEDMSRHNRAAEELPAAELESSQIESEDDREKREPLRRKMSAVEVSDLTVKKKKPR